ncbi:CHAT domain-containing protein [Tenacibaculum sp. MAR_2009_124]|uniref:CHAT domain-containing protein n=1 Tax=Tenacibaculum sp. MAR_2009_124 TaxID=1250059 RepID=UPI0008985A45|nr:CHAT domain-containing protein [Tenacibaculum sp. MAR_2009_124]SEB40651.1 CHAT domain-containing protein [Tenacibaculum sp. MAR_2009_124]
MNRFFVFFLLISVNLNAQSSDKIRSIDTVFYSNLSGEIKIKQVLDILSNEGISSSPKQANIYHKLGLLANSIGRYEKAIEYTRKSVDLRKQSTNIDYYKLLNSLYNLSYYFGRLNRIDKKKAIIKEILGYSVENKFRYKATIDLAYLISEEGDYFRTLEKFDNVINNYDKYEDPKTLLKAHEGAIYAYSEIDKSERYFDKISNHIDGINYLLKTYKHLSTSIGHDNNLANIYEGQKDYQRAIEFYKKSEDISLKYQDSVKLGDIYNNLGRIYNIVGKQKLANEFFVKSLKFSSGLRSKAAVYNNQGDLLDESIQLLNNKKAIETLLGTSYEELPLFQEIKESEYIIDIVDYLIQSVDAGTKFYTKKSDTNGVNKIIDMTMLVDKLISLLRRESLVDMSKLLWIERASEFYMNGVTLAYHMKNSPLAFYFMEKNKGLLLLEGLHKSNNEYYKEPKLEALTENVNDFVNDGTSFVEYIMNENEGYGLFYGNESHEFFKLSNVPQLLANVKKLKRRVREYFKNEQEKEEYKELANSIFKTLFPFENSFDKIKNKELIIVPDYELQYINFETLVPKSSDGYLVETTEVRYLLSLSIADHLKRQDKISKLGVFGIAPIHFKESSLPSLERSSAIMNEVSNSFISRMLIGETATKRKFITDLENYKIVHLNTHAGIDEIENEPWLMFYDGSLSFYEISQLRNNADLVVLDVCNGAIGEHEVGEGVMSLARGFFKGGAKSVVTSQWEANEKAVTEILTHFYKGLSKGQTKSKALQLAKKKYLENHQLSEVSPYYWGALVLTGNTDAIIPQVDYFRLIWVVVVMLLIFATSKLLISY